VDRVINAATTRIRVESTAQLTTQLDAKLQEVRGDFTEYLDSRLQAADQNLSVHLGQLSDRIDAVESAAGRIPPDAPMPEQNLSDSAVAAQLRSKNEIIEQLRSELTTLRNRRTTAPAVHTGDGITTVSGAPLQAEESGELEHPHWDALMDVRTSRAKVPLGPRFPGLQEIVPDDPKFLGVLSYRRYRLLNTDPTQNADVTAAVGLHIRRLEHSFRSRKFTGAEPLAIIGFLDHFRRECDLNSLSEGAAILCLPKFLDGDAYVTYDAHLALGSEEIGGFSSYPAAVNFLLRMYATDANIELAVQAFETLAQEPNEDVQDFARRVRKVARATGGVHTERELITRFQRGLRPELRPLSTREPHERKIHSLHEATGYAY